MKKNPRTFASGLSARARKVLDRLGAREWADLANLSPLNLWLVRGCGEATAAEIIAAARLVGVKLWPNRSDCPKSMAAAVAWVRRRWARMDPTELPI